MINAIISLFRQTYPEYNHIDDALLDITKKVGYDVWKDDLQKSSIFESYPEIIGIGIILSVVILIVDFRKVKSKQVFALWSLVPVIIGMLLFPPFQIQIKGAEINMGYSLIFNPP